MDYLIVVAFGEMQMLDKMLKFVCLVDIQSDIKIYPIKATRDIRKNRNKITDMSKLKSSVF